MQTFSTDCCLQVLVFLGTACNWWASKLTACSKMFQKGTVIQLLRKMPAVQGTQMFITIVTRAHHVCLMPNESSRHRSIILLPNPFQYDSSKTASSKRPLFFAFLHQDPADISLLTYFCHSSPSSHPPSSDHLNSNWWAGKMVKLFTRIFFSYSRYPP
jgi:hypothetical protein